MGIFDGNFHGWGNFMVDLLGDFMIFHANSSNLVRLIGIGIY